MASPNLAVSGQIGRRAVKSARRVVEAPILSSPRRTSTYCLSATMMRSICGSQFARLAGGRIAEASLRQRDGGGELAAGDVTELAGIVAHSKKIALGFQRRLGYVNVADDCRRQRARRC